MLFPIRVTLHTQTKPTVTKLLLLINVLFFVYEVGWVESEEFFYNLGVIPLRYTETVFQTYIPLGKLILPLFTHQFIHAGLIHLVMNLWVLWIFGVTLEDRLGHWRFLGCYILWGMVAAATEIVFYPSEEIPIIGASGAIAGIMGAYMVLMRYVRIQTLVFLLFFVTLWEMPATYFLVYWFLMQWLYGLNALHAGEWVEVAWWAHKIGRAHV